MSSFRRIPHLVSGSSRVARSPRVWGSCGLGLALIAWVLPLWCAGCSGSTAPIDRSASDVERGTVTVVIEMGEQTIRREVEAVPAGTTLAQVMAEISDPPVKITGSGAMTFIESIGELGTTAGKGWLFEVDGQRADRGAGVYELTPPAEVRWWHTSTESTEQ